MRALSWAGFCASAAAALYGLLGLRQLRRSERPSRPAALRALAFGIGLFAAVAFLLAALDDGLADQLATAPGAELAFPGGYLLDTTRTGSVGHAGAYIERTYVVDAPDGAIIAWFDAELGRLGYQLDPAQPVPPSDDWPRPRVLRQYSTDCFAYRIELRPLPVRAGGKTVPAGPGSALSARIMTAP
jgi:hypothetical protein